MDTISEEDKPRLRHALQDHFRVTSRGFIYFSFVILAILFYTLKNSQSENELGDFKAVQGVEMWLGLMAVLTLVALCFFLLNLLSSDKVRNYVSILIFAMLGFFWGALFLEFLVQVKNASFIVPPGDICYTFWYLFLSYERAWARAWGLSEQ